MASEAASSVAPVPSKETWAHRHEPKFRALLIERYLGLTRSIVSDYARTSEPFEDLLQVAMVGLLKAIDRYEPERGEFVAYAYPTIRGEIRRYFRDCCWAVHVPRGPQDAALRFLKAEYRLAELLGRRPTMAELAEHLELDVEQVLEAKLAAHAYHSDSLDGPPAIQDVDSNTLGDTVGVLDGNYELAECRALLARTLRYLPKQQRRVLVLRFWADMTQTEIAAVIGCSQMHISRILRRAIERLQALAQVPGDELEEAA